MAFSFVTININGLIEEKKTVRFFSWLIKRKFDIISLQETHGTVSDIEKWEKNWKDLGGSFSLWNNRERASREVAILFNTGQGVVIKEDKKDNDGRVLSCEIKIENQIYKLINIHIVHCPNNKAERKQIILSIDRYLDIDGPTCNILNGDFN